MKKFRPLISLVLAAAIALSPVCTSTAFAAEIDEPVIVEEVVEEISEIVEETSEVVTETPEVVEEEIVETPEEEVVTEETEDVYDTVGGSIDGIGGGTVTPPFADNVSNSYQSVNADDLTTILRGVQGGDKEEAFDFINKWIGEVLKTGKYLYVPDDNFVDAEKYKFPGYDSNHCWAATASNILWTTGYAKDVVNPMTGRTFGSEDEVMTYFTTNFTDLPGCPEDAVNWFFYGKDGYKDLEGARGVAQIKDYSEGGLLKEVKPTSFFYNVKYDLASQMSAIYDVASHGMGVLVRWFASDKNNCTEDGLTLGAHWATISGVVYDETKSSNPADSIKAIILADSDNNPVNKTLTSDSLISEVLAAKSAQPNSYTVYRVVYDDVKKLWLINNYGGPVAVITHLYGLMDSDKSPQGAGGADTFNPKDITGDPINLIPTEDGSFTAEIMGAVKALNESGATGEDGEEIYIIVQQPAKKAVAEDAESVVLKSLSEKDFEKMENIEALLAYMIKNAKPVFLMNDGVATAGNDYVCYISAANTKLYHLTIDGLELPADAYKLIATKNGMTKLVLNKDYLALFGNGTHEVKVSVEGSDIPTRFEVTLM